MDLLSALELDLLLKAYELGDATAIQIIAQWTMRMQGIVKIRQALLDAGQPVILYPPAPAPKSVA